MLLELLKKGFPYIDLLEKGGRKKKRKKNYLGGKKSALWVLNNYFYFSKSTLVVFKKINKISAINNLAASLAGFLDSKPLT
jgi:hypothetical protein